MASDRPTPTRGERIVDESLADACCPEKVASGPYWYCDSKPSFPFSARCVEPRSISSRQGRGEADLLRTAKEQERTREVFALIRLAGRESAMRFSQLNPALGAPEVRRVVDNWRYWVATSDES